MQERSALREIVFECKAWSSHRAYRDEPIIPEGYWSERRTWYVTSGEEPVTWAVNWIRRVLHEPMWTNSEWRPGTWYLGSWEPKSQGLDPIFEYSAVLDGFLEGEERAIFQLLSAPTLCQAS